MIAIIRLPMEVQVRYTHGSAGELGNEGTQKTGRTSVE